MTGRIDHTLAEEPRHVCKPPAIYRFGTPTGEPFAVPPVHFDHPVGTRFHCDCGQVWVVRWHTQPGLRPNGPVWSRESRGERRKRLGLRWWQR